MRALRNAYPGVRLEELSVLGRELTGHPLTLELRKRALTTSTRVDLGGRGPVTLLVSDEHAVALEVEAELALALVSSLAGGRALPRIAMGRKVDPLVGGALAGILQHAARSCGEDELAIGAIDPPLDELRRALPGDLLALDATVALGSIRASVRVVATVPERTAGRRLDAREVLRAMRGTPRTLPYVIGAGYATARALGDLEAGDVMVVDGRTQALAAERSSTGVAVEALPDGRLRIGTGKEAIQLAPEPSPVERKGMPDPDASGATVEMPALADEASPIAEALADMPVLVRVEAGSVTLPAREWATLGAGDVVVLDARVGEAVTLRVGGKVVGRGELVEVDGSIGVRITERAP